MNHRQSPVSRVLVLLLRPAAILLFLASAGVISGVALAADSPADLVRYRQAVMKAMGGHMTAAALVVKKQVTDRSQLAAHADALHGSATGLAGFFPPQTGPERTRTSAKPEIWRQWPEFAAAALKLERETAKLAVVARAGDAKAFDAQFANVGTACNECHKEFRVRDAD